MIRIALVACLSLLTACKSRSTRHEAAGGGAPGSSAIAKAEPPRPAVTTPPSGAIPKLRWTDTDGELLLATGDGSKLEGPCGSGGTISQTQVELGGTKQDWNIIQRTGNKFSLPTLDWVIEVSPSGEVTHSRGGTKTPLGTVTGADTDEHLAWFGALVIAAPLIQHKVGIESLDGTVKVYVQGAADLRAWDARGLAGERIATKRRDDPRPVLSVKPAFDPEKVTVTASGARTQTVDIKRDDDAIKKVFPADKLFVTESDTGDLAWSLAEAKPGTPFARVSSRAKCRAHDRAVTALVWTLLDTDAGAKLLGAPDRTSK